MALLVFLASLTAACGSRMQTQTTPPSVAAAPPRVAPNPTPAPREEVSPEEVVVPAPEPPRSGGVAPPGRAATRIAPESDSVAIGDASWYGDPYHGRPTASGEIFDKNKLTAAHRTLPFDTWIRVENELNGKSVDVRVNDRGPFVTGRIVDLSEAAAREIDMIRDGVVPVTVEVIQEAANASTERPDLHVFYVVQVGAFREEDRAHQLRRDLERRYTGVYVEAPTPGSEFFKVRIGRALLSDARMLQGVILEREEIQAIVLEME